MAVPWTELKSKAHKTSHDYMCVEAVLQLVRFVAIDVERPKERFRGLRSSVNSREEKIFQVRQGAYREEKENRADENKGVNK